jgi:integrase
MPLTDRELRNIKPTSKTRKVSDERGLYLEVSPSGGRWWRLKYRFAGKEKRLSLGVYPDVGLKDARDRRDDARKLLANGVDPSANRKASKQATADRSANSFEVVAREWFGKYGPGWAQSHSSKVINRLENDIFPYIGKRPIADINAPELLEVVRRVEKRTVETSHRALGTCGQIFRYAIATGRCTRDPSADLRGALAPFKSEHMAATTEPKRLGQILRLMDNYPGTIVVQSALRVAPYVFVRPGELRKAAWPDFDLDGATWSYIASKTKTQHIVPLADQAVKVLRELYQVTGSGRLAFPGARNKTRPMSENAVIVAMRSMEIGKEEMTGHGLRAVARTLLDEVLKFRPDFIDHQLAHAVRDPNGRAYNRTAHLDERRKMMQAWADYLDELKSGV